MSRYRFRGYSSEDCRRYSPDELPDRDVTKIKHSLVADSMELLGPLVRDGKVKVWFTHLNHSNPALDPRNQCQPFPERASPFLSGNARASATLSGFGVLGAARPGKSAYPYP